MIYQLTGVIADLAEDFVVIDVKGVGYQVFISTLVRDTLSIDSSIKLQTYHHIREDNQTLFGFLNADERAMFISLISVSGVGPKAGLKILSQFPLDTLMQLIVKEDVTSLTHVPGIGKKTAERVIIELKDKIAKMPQSISMPKGSLLSKSAIQDDVIVALKGLGYSIDEVKRAISKTEGFSSISSLEEGIKRLLRNL